MKPTSVICTTYNRKKMTEEWLDHIGPCLPDKAEVIVSDDCSTDGTQDMLASYKAPYPMKVVTKEVRGGFSDTAGRAQDVATGNWVLVTQNDCMFKKDSIDALIETFKTVEWECGREIGCIGIAGGIVLRDRNHDLLDWSNWNGDGVVGYNMKILFRYVQVDYLNGFLLLYRRKLATKHNIRFDPKYIPSWDDVDISYQFHRNGYPVMMVSMDAYDIPHIHHIRNVTIKDPVVFPEYNKGNVEMKRRFLSKWYE